MVDQAQEDRFVAVLTELGGSAGNGRLREALGWDEQAYDAVKDALIAQDRTRKEFSDADIAKITRAYHAWRGEGDAGAYEDVPGFCKSATLEDIKSHGYVLTPGRYVGAAEADEDEMPFAERISLLSSKLDAQFSRSDDLNTIIRQKLGWISANV